MRDVRCQRYMNDEYDSREIVYVMLSARFIY
jgi:hypothetical protein